MKTLSVTATQGGLSKEQLVAAFTILTGVEDLEFHFGGCVGGDAQLYRIVKEHTDARTICHRGNTIEKWDFFDDIDDPDETISSKDNIERNHDMVNCTSELLAFPGEMENVLRSGTWATIRYARRVNRKVTIIYPDGSTEASHAETRA